jgi:hypothetical protein
VTRRYQAIAVACPRCGANPGRACLDARPMRGVHRDRDLAFNRREFERRREAGRA